MKKPNTKQALRIFAIILGITGAVLIKAGIPFKEGTQFVLFIGIGMLLMAIGLWYAKRWASLVGVIVAILLLVATKEVMPSGPLAFVRINPFGNFMPAIVMMGLVIGTHKHLK